MTQSNLMDKNSTATPCDRIVVENSGRMIATFAGANALAQEAPPAISFINYQSRNRTAVNGPDSHYSNNPLYTANQLNFCMAELYMKLPPPVPGTSNEHQFELTFKASDGSLEPTKVSVLVVQGMPTQAYINNGPVYDVTNSDNLWLDKIYRSVNHKQMRIITDSSWIGAKVIWPNNALTAYFPTDNSILSVRAEGSPGGDFTFKQDPATMTEAAITGEPLQEIPLRELAVVTFNPMVAAASGANTLQSSGNGTGSEEVAAVVASVSDPSDDCKYTKDGCGGGGTRAGTGSGGVYQCTDKTTPPCSDCVPGSGISYAVVYNLGTGPLVVQKKDADGFWQTNNPSQSYDQLKLPRSMNKYPDGAPFSPSTIPDSAKKADFLKALVYALSIKHGRNITQTDVNNVETADANEFMAMVFDCFVDPPPTATPTGTSTGTSAGNPTGTSAGNPSGNPTPSPSPAMCSSTSACPANYYCSGGSCMPQYQCANGTWVNSSSACPVPTTAF